ncbi:MAG: YitT family protein [Eubacteriales bacterium]|nr:YitT family protein [Eubacteriales bacterium]
MSKTVKNILNIFMILLGNSVYALGIVMFVLPNGLITGGTTGLALTMDHFFGFPISVFVMIFNVSMFTLGLFILGKKFALTTLISTFYYPFILGIFQRFPSLANATDDKMLATVCAGIMIGFGIGVVIKAGASTGGMDIPPLVLNKKFGLPVSVMIYLFDFSILILQMLFSNIEQTLYGILLVLIYTFVLDKILTFGTAQTQVKIISQRYKEINNAIIHKLDRGSSLIHITTGYLENEEMMVLSVISNRELPQLKQIVNDIDPDAFLTISRIYETRGRGFSLQKKYLEQR